DESALEGSPTTMRLLALLLTLALVARTPLATPLAAHADGGALYRSDDAGKTWAQLPTSLNVQTVYALLADIAQPGHLMVASEQSLWTTDDEGATWAQRSLAEADSADAADAVYALSADPDAPERVWAASERGVFASG